MLKVYKNTTKKALLRFYKWWPRPRSNRRHTDFQSVALPAELPGHFLNKGGGPDGDRTRDLLRDREAC